MVELIFKGVVVCLFFVITACGGGDAGALEGTWELNGIIPMVVTFRSGETETLGVIEKVSYETKGNDVLVTYKNGPMKGTSIRYTILDKNTVKSQIGILRRVK